MQGSGTQDNPYIYTTWAEFVECASQSNVYCKQGKDIDMNEELPNGVTETVNLNCKELDGNGYEIRNAYFIDNGQIKTDSNFGLMKNFKLINFYDARTSSGKDGTISYSKGSIIDLTISGFVLSSNKYAIITPSKKIIKGLSANIDGAGGGFSGDSAWYTLEIQNGNIRMNGGNVQSVSFKNCYLNGKANLIYLGYDSEYEGSSASIIDAEVISQFAGQNSQNAVVYNSDKVSPSLAITGNFIPVTTEQLADATYLRSVGFPIGVD